VRQQLEEIECEAEIVIEPERRDSRPANPRRRHAGAAGDCAVRQRRLSRIATLLADFRNAAHAAEKGGVVTFGIARRLIGGGRRYAVPTACLYTARRLYIRKRAWSPPSVGRADGRS
jgi:hypothetical protein